MFVSKIKLNAQIEKLDKLDRELGNLKDDREKVLTGWNVEGVTDLLGMDDFIKEKKREIEIEEATFAEMEAVYEGREVEKPKPWEKKRIEPELFSFC